MTWKHTRSFLDVTYADFIYGRMMRGIVIAASTQRTSAWSLAILLSSRITIAIAFLAFRVLVSKSARSEESRRVARRRNGAPITDVFHLARRLVPRKRASPRGLNTRWKFCECYELSLSLCSGASRKGRRESQLICTINWHLQRSL